MLKMRYKKMHIVVEEAELQDSSSIGSLVQDELGYTNLDINKLTDRFQRMKQNNDYLILVAKDANVVVGFIGLCKGIAFELDGEFMRIIALAVKKDYQHRLLAGGGSVSIYVCNSIFGRK
jgi:predicted N-acetyltransferase YhbS